MSDKFKAPAPHFGWTSYKMHESGWEHCRVGRMCVYVKDQRPYTTSNAPKKPHWRVEVHAADGPTVTKKYKGGGSTTWTETRVPLLPLTSKKFKSKIDAKRAAEAMFRQIIRFAADMVAVETKVFVP